MRDIAVAVIIIGLIPVILKYPWTGVLVFAWVSIFNPHRFAWGFAYDFQFAMIVGVVTVVSMLLHWKEVRLPINSITILLMLLPFWMTVTLLFALEPNEAYVRWKEVMKTFCFTLVAASLLHSRKQLEALLWVLVLSVGFYGVKGGIFTFVVGGGMRVWGPPGTSFLSDNNSISVALIMIIPLIQFLATTVSSMWVKCGMYGAIFLSGIAVLGSQSRGAFLAILAMVVFLWLKSRQKVLSGMVLLIVGAIYLGFMPEEWKSRMTSIAEYEQDTSAMGRLNSWHMAINLANDRPLLGGGFEPYTPKVFAMYAPDPTDVRSAHSIYFQMLGEHGYVGLALFLTLGIASWMVARRIIKASRNRPEYAWHNGLARAIQVSLIGFAAGGAFVNISYWEVQYYLIVVLMAAYRLTEPMDRKPGKDVMKTAPTVAIT